MALEPRQRFYILLGVILAIGLVFYVGMAIGQRVNTQSIEPSSNDLALLDQSVVGAVKTEYDFFEHLDKPVQTRRVPRNEVIVEQRRKVLERKAKIAQRRAGKTPEGTPTTQGERVTHKTPQSAPDPLLEKPRELERIAAPATGDEPKPAPIEVRQIERQPTSDRQVAMNTPRTKTLQRTPSSYTLQVSAYRDQSEAFALSKKLKSDGFSAFVISEEIPGQGKWYRVRVGRYSSKGSAQSDKKRLEAQGQRAFVTQM